MVEAFEVLQGSLCLVPQPSLWQLSLSDLSTWGSGICYTYDPPRSFTDMSS